MSSAGCGRSWLYEVIEGRLLLEEISRGRFGDFGLERALHPLVPAVLLRMAWLNPFDLNPEAQHQTASLLSRYSARRAGARTCGG
jgi:hypothetical protein